MTRRAVLLDANSLIVRNIHATALEDLKADGTFTGGVFGALNQLKSMLNTFHTLSKDKAGPVYAFFDDGVPQFRKDAIPTYKQERKEKKELMTPEDKARAYEQIKIFRDLLPLLGVRVYSLQNWEADDLVAAGSRQFVEQGSIVVSGDKDLWQLVNESCSICYLNDKTELLSTANFQEYVGVPTGCFLVWKLLQGDNSDSIPGVRGIGETRATKLVTDELEKDFRFCDQKPIDQLVQIINTTRTREKPRKSEECFWDDDQMDALASALQGIDLSCGSPDIVPALNLPAKTDVKAFMAKCCKFKFARIVGDITNFMRPFDNAL
jgi:5'-3' exonuclease